jgi:hypothetical protein
MKKITPLLLLFLALCLSDCKDGFVCCAPPPPIEYFFVSVKDTDGNDLLDPTAGNGFRWEDIRIRGGGQDNSDGHIIDQTYFDYSHDKGIYELMLQVFPIPSAVVVFWNETESDTLKIVDRTHYTNHTGEEFDLYVNGVLQKSYKHVELVKLLP